MEQVSSKAGRTSETPGVFKAHPRKTREPSPNLTHIYIYGGVWVQLLRVQGTCARVTLVLRECTLNTPAVSLVLPAFDDTVSQGNPPRRAVYPRVPPR